MALAAPFGKEGSKGNVLFNDALNTFLFTVIWRRRYGKDSEMGNPAAASKATFSD